MKKGKAWPLFQAPVVAIALVFMGAILHSSKAIFIKLAYRYEVDSVSLVALRMAMALPFFLGVAWWSHRRQLESQWPFIRRHLPRLIGLGLAGYYLASLLDFWSLQYLPAGLGRLVLFTYPTLVLLLSALFMRRPIHWMEGVALILCYIGVYLAFAKMADAAWGEGFGWGIALSFGSALSYAVYLIGSGEYLPRLGTLTYTSLTMSIACLGILIHHGIQYQWDLFGFPAPVYYLSLGMALLATVAPSFMVGEGIRRLGASESSIISSFGPISTIILAYIFLGEAFGPWQWLGAVFVIGGVLTISLRQKRRGN